VPRSDMIGGAFERRTDISRYGDRGAA